MNIKHIGICAVACGVTMYCQPFKAMAEESTLLKITVPHNPAEGHGQHDFDFEVGSWKIHLKRLLHPLTGSTSWVEYDGTSVTRKLWGGRAFIEEFETDGPSGHIEGLTLRLYNPQSHQWSIHWASSRDGALTVPAFGEFRNGVGEFLDYEPINGRYTLVRLVWSRITPNSAHSEQAFSVDGGKTWEVNWITDQTRISNGSDTAQQDSAR